MISSLVSTLSNPSGIDEIRDAVLKSMFFFAITCTTSGAQNVTITPSSGNTYYLVVPTNGAAEGSYGLDSASAERSQGSSACATQMIGDCP